MYKRWIKRGLDIGISSVALVLLMPLLVVVAVWLYIANKGGDVFFLQPRPGYHGKVFNIIKFKSMSDARDTSGNLLPDESRVTAAGRFVRATSIDELPQLINIIKGDMSLVGPRPLLVQYLPLYSPEQARRHSVRPGLTGWAQCHGRNAVTWAQRFEHDVWYVDHCSFATDCKVVGITLCDVVKNLFKPSHDFPAMEPFDGNN